MQLLHMNYLPVITILFRIQVILVCYSFTCCTVYSYVPLKAEEMGDRVGSNFRVGIVCVYVCVP